MLCHMRIGYDYWKLTAQDVCCGVLSINSLLVRYQVGKWEYSEVLMCVSRRFGRTK
jgi:hypothetical protein